MRGLCAMAKPRLYLLLLVLLQLQTNVFCNQYKVGDLDAWGIPSSTNPLVYAEWSKIHTFAAGDSLLFLYPPSQDSVIQVTAQSFVSCNLQDPILYMDNGNSLFNVTEEGSLYFISGEAGHCQKKQKLHIAVGNVSDDSPAAHGPSALPDSAPPSSSPSLRLPGVIITAVTGCAAAAIISGVL